MMNSNTDRFNFFVEIDNVDDLIKASKKEGEDRYDNMVVRGIASTNSEDTDEEILEPSGFILDLFLKSGIINWEHQAKTNPDSVIGEPTKAFIRDNNFHVEGKLYKDVPLARKVWDMMINLATSGSTRKVGWSIEGKSLQKDPRNEKRITKARIRHIALTLSPKNSNTWADIVKGEQAEDFIEPEPYFDETADGGAEYILDVTRPDGMRVKVDKNLNVVVEKAMTTDTARPLIKESLDNKLKKLQPEFIKSVVELRKGGKISDDIFEKIKKNIRES